MKKVLISQARLSSTRLPGKVLLDLGGKSVIKCHLERLLKAEMVDEFVLAMADEDGSNKLEEDISELQINCFKGDRLDVLDRFYKAAKKSQADAIVRVTADCPLVDPAIVDSVVRSFLDQNVDYVSNTLNPSFPDGMDVEVFKMSALESAWENAKLNSEREHVTPYIWKNSTYFEKGPFKAFSYESSIDNSDIRLTIDEAEDYELIKDVILRIGFEASCDEYVNLLNSDNSIDRPNESILRNEGYFKSVKGDKR